MEKTVLEIHAAKVKDNLDDLKLVLATLANQDIISERNHITILLKIDEVEKNIPTMQTFVKHISEHGEKRQQANNFSTQLENVVIYKFPGTHHTITLK